MQCSIANTATASDDPSYRNQLQQRQQTQVCQTATNMPDNEDPDDTRQRGIAQRNEQCFIVQYRLGPSYFCAQPLGVIACALR